MAIVIWSILSNLFTFRDNFLSPAYRLKLNTSALVGGWDWHIWIIGCLGITLIAALEGCYRVHAGALRATEAKHLEIIATKATALTLEQEEHKRTTEAHDRTLVDLIKERDKNQGADFSESRFSECLIDTFLTDPHNLRGSPGHGTLMLTSYLAVSVYLVNTRPQAVTLRDWSLCIEFNGQIYIPKLEKPNSKDRVVRRELQMRGFDLDTIEKGEPLLPALDTSIEFLPNRGVTVWTAWLLVGAEQGFKDQGTFKLCLTDSRRHTHSFERPIGPWPDTGKLGRWG